MNKKKKLKKCRLSTCKKEFEPQTEWQKFCCPKHRDFVNNQKYAKTVKAMRKFFEAHATPQDAI